MLLMIYEQRFFELLGHIFATNAAHVIFLSMISRLLAKQFRFREKSDYILTCLRVQSKLNSTYAYHVDIAGRELVDQ